MRSFLLCCIALGVASAQVDTIPGVATSIVETHHTITIAGKPLGYTARAGMLPIRNNDDASVRAYVFFVAYVADHGRGAPTRPITFAWNGGPGANSLLLHLDAFGPRRVDSTRLTDNPETLLPQTDLVFMDAVGTGFSRLADSKYAPDFYGVREDIAATREFIRVYRTRFDAWDQPLYLAGESYGTWRAAGVAAAMADAGEPVNGVILISGGIPVGPVATSQMRAALFLPERVATAAYHRKLVPALQSDPARAMREAEEWGRSVYVPALLRKDSLSEGERSAIMMRLSRYTGLDTSAIDRKTLIVDRRMWLNRLVPGDTLGTFDTRRRALRGDSPARVALISDYLRHVLGFRTDLRYLGLEPVDDTSGVNANPNGQWQYDQGDPDAPLVPNNDGPPGGTPPYVQRAFASDPKTRWFVAAGEYDSLNSCALIAYQVSQLAPALRARVALGCYAGGHMIYEDASPRAALRRDLGKFYSP
jgi:carboxypeptidase C (cathepsin A)